MSDKDYPKEVAQTLLVKVVDSFVSKYPVETITDCSTFCKFPELDGLSQTS